jgi:AAHS family 4-hydroxybenzoate transporter-like MFS transporter
MPEARRGKLLTWLFIGHGLGASAAGLFGPTFVQHASWQAAFWAGGLLLLVLVPLLFLYLPESCRYLVLRNPRDPRIGQLLKRVDPSFVPLSDALFVTAEAKPKGSPVAGLFREGRAVLTALLWLAMAMALCATATLSAWLPSFLHVLAGLETATATRMSAVSAFGAVCGPILLTMLMKRMSLAHALSLTLFIAAGAMTGFAAVAGLHWLGWVLGFAYGLFVIGSQAGLNSLVASSYPTAMRSTGIGWAGGLGRITSMIGPGLGGAMLAAKWSPIAIYAALATPLFIAAVAMLLLAWLRPAAANGREA